MGDTSGKVSGSACGYYTDVGLFGGPPTRRGCGQAIPPGDERSASPSVALPPEGSSTAVTVEDDNGAVAQYGPAIVFGGKGDAERSGPMRVSTKGKRSVTSSAAVKDFSAGPFTADSVRSACSASQSSGATGSTTISRGVLVTATDADGQPTKSEKLPSRPPPNYTRKGVNSTGDKFRAVFNEQKVARDGTITVTALHLYLLGPLAQGDVVVAQSRAKA
ncbi:MAG: hypothetical protein M3326_04465 [Actinomycetota bacterium]|nr:hypothetical protein [Actinomycetota bacterium]